MPKRRVLHSKTRQWNHKTQVLLQKDTVVANLWTYKIRSNTCHVPNLFNSTFASLWLMMYFFSLTIYCLPVYTYLSPVFVFVPKKKAELQLV